MSAPIRIALVCGAILAALVTAAACVAVMRPADGFLGHVRTADVRPVPTPEPRPRPRDRERPDLSELEPLRSLDRVPAPECTTIPGIIAHADLPEVYAGTLEESTGPRRTKGEDNLGCLRVELVR